MKIYKLNFNIFYIVKKCLWIKKIMLFMFFFIWEIVKILY
jgi:hypothetical protein